MLDTGKQLRQRSFPTPEHFRSLRSLYQFAKLFGYAWTMHKEADGYKSSDPT